MANAAPPNPRTVIAWDAERVKQFRALARAKMSARAIANTLLTAEERAGLDDGGRNAIIGKAHREGIKLKGNTAKTARPNRATGPSKPRVLA